MASIAAVTLSEAILPLTSSFNPADVRTVKVENKWTTNRNNVAEEHYFKMYLPVCDDPSQKELFLYVVNQFKDAAHADRLHLTTGEGIYTKFRGVLDGALRLSWQALSDGRANKTVNTFAEDVRALIAEFMSPTSYEDQLEFLRGSTKPFNVSCEELGARLKVISRLGKYLPGAYDATNATERNLFDGDNAYKRAYYSLMPQAWKLEFAKSAHSLDGAGYTYTNLVRYMAVQEALSKRGINKRKNAPHDNRNHRGGGRGRGGSGYGSGYSSYGSGRGNGYGRGGNYQRRGGGRGYGRGRGSGYAGFGSGYSSYGNQYQSPNPTTTGTSSPTRQYSSGYHATPASGRAYGRGGQGRGYVSYSNRPQRPMVQGRGPPPNFPSFMVEQDHYYQEEGEQFYDEDQYFQEGDPYVDQFYGEHDYVEEQGAPSGELYYGDNHNGTSEPAPAPKEAPEPVSECHWLDEFKS